MTEPDHHAGTWLDTDAGPVVRPYAMTSGRTRPTRGAFDLISIVLAVRPPDATDMLRSPEAIAILTNCQQPMSVAEISAALDLPAGTVKVLLGDLLADELIITRDPIAATMASNPPVLEAVLHGLRAL